LKVAFLLVYGIEGHIDSLGITAKIICAGDFNAWPNPVEKKLNTTISAPRFNIVV